MLRVEHMTVRFAGLTAVDDLSFQVEQGEIFTMMGPNGAGKTTAFNAITGFVRPAAGRISYGDQSLLDRTPDNIANLGIRRTFQNSGILREMTVLENVLTGLELSIPHSFWRTVTGMPSARRAERQAVAQSLKILDRLGIADLAGRVAGDLSFGQQRLVEIARALVANARLIMLDEPAVGLSPSDRHHLGVVLRGLAGDGIAIVLVEHVQDLVMAVSDRILVLNYGKCLAEGTPDAVRHNKAVLEAYLGQE
jgi:branched-chain amino acid transport system ATP-binding protein